MFAIKQNKNVSFKSIEDECHVLSRLADNDYIIKFLGAVIDEGELRTQPPLVCKMMMELAESKSLLIITTQRPVEQWRIHGGARGGYSPPTFSSPH